MKRFLLSVAVLTIAGIVWHRRAGQLPPSELAPSGESVRRPVTAPEATGGAAVAIEHEKPPRILSKEKKKGPVPEDARTVHFQVVDGYAVAQGDLLLGKPDDPSVREGHFQMPLPQYWDRPEIPYVIDREVVEPARIHAALNHIHDSTGFAFVPYTGQPDAVVFRKGSKHCLSVLGRQGGVQPIRLAPNCGVNEIVHEVLHAMGFIHEQSRTDRDESVEILWGNIDEPYAAEFEALALDFMGPARDTPFDYQSIMLYGPGVFAKEAGLMTMKSKTDKPIAPSEAGLSPGDIERIKSFYNLKR